MNNLMTQALMMALGSISFRYGDWEIYKTGDASHTSIGELYNSRLPIKYGSIEEKKLNKDGFIIITLNNPENKVTLTLKVGDDVMDIINHKEVKAIIQQALSS